MYNIVNVLWLLEHVTKSSAKRGSKFFLVKLTTRKRLVHNSKERKKERKEGRKEGRKKERKKERRFVNIH
jgi:hypothetical protein